MDDRTDYRFANCLPDRLAALATASGVQVDPEDFFPVGSLAESGCQVDLTRAVCRACPISELCLQDHIGQEFGFFGGTTPDERRAIRRRMSLRMVTR